MRKIVSILMVVLILMSTLSTVFALKPVSAIVSESSKSSEDSLTNRSATTLQSKANQDLSSNLKSASQNPIEELSTQSSKASQNPSQQSSYDPNRWEFNDTSVWSKSAYLDGNKTRLIVGLSESTDPLELEKTAARFGSKVTGEVSIGGKAEAVVVELPLASVAGFVEEVRRIGLAAYVEPNMRVQVQLVPNDPYWSRQWGPRKIEADWAWDSTRGNRSVLVAIVDTGVDYTHPDLAPNYDPLGFDWVNSDPDPIDDYGHGTHCAGIVAAVLDNYVGIAGIAQVRIMAEKVLNSGGFGYWDWIANGITHAVDQGADIVSLSLGGYGESEAVHEAVRYAQASGVLVVAAAANDNTNMRAYPAAYDEVVAVSATDQYDDKAAFSNWGDWIELAAPGVDIYSTMPTYHVTLNDYGYSMDYDYLSGTSMACPHVSGVAALIWSAYPNATSDWVRFWLRPTADDLGAPGFDEYFGYGRVNARKAVGQSLPSHELVAYAWNVPPYVKPGSSATIELTVLNFGQNNETNIVVDLMANDTVEASTVIGFIANANLATVSLVWTPSGEGTFNVTGFVEPVAEEAHLDNNALSQNVYVGYAIKAVVLHSAGNVIGETITNWQVLNSEWSQFGDTMVYIDYNTLNKESITYEDIVATEADALIISCAVDPYAGWQFTDSEIEAIERYTHEGHGLIVTCGTFYSTVPNNNKLAHLFGLNETIAWTVTENDLLHISNRTHPIFRNVPDPFIFPSVATVLPADGRWDSSELTGGKYLALGHYKEAAIVSYRGLAFISSWLEVIPPYYFYHLQLLYNAIAWSRYQKPVHELSVSLESPIGLQPGETTVLNATVTNEGLSNETDVELCLLINSSLVGSATIPQLMSGNSYTIGYSWNPTVEAHYNVTAFVPPVSGEESALNNVVSKSINVRYFIARVAVLNSIEIPSYFVGGWGNNYGILVDALNANGFYAQAITNEEIAGGALSFFDVFVMVDNVPTESNVLLVKAFWIDGGGIVAFDSSICFLCYSGILPPESSGNNGYTIYWDYGTSSQARISVAHPITEGYEVGQIIYGTSGDSEFSVDALAGSSAYPYYTTLVEDVYGPNRAYVSAYEAPAAGNVVHIWDDKHWENGELQRMILNTVGWANGYRYEHDLGVTLEVPSIIPHSPSIEVKATVANRGLTDEADVNLLLIINDTTEESRDIAELASGVSYTITYLWTPAVGGAHYNITAFATPVLGENFTSNNRAGKMVYVSLYGREYLPVQPIFEGDPMEWHADDASWPLNLSFVFPFYDKYYRAIYVSSNGLITFNEPDSSFSNSLSALAGKSAVAVAWDDWTTQAVYEPYDIYVWQNETCVGVQWIVRHFGSSTVAIFGAILRYDGIIQFDYGYSDDLVTATIGISNGAGDMLAEDLTYLSYIKTIRFTPHMLRHDVAATAVETSASEAIVGDTVNVTVTTENQGNFTETYTVTAYASSQANSMVIGSPSNSTRIYLDPSNYTFDAAGVSVGYRFNVTVIVENVANLAGWQLSLSYNDAIINVTRWFEPKWDPTYVFYGKGTTALPPPPEFGYRHEGLDIGTAMVAGILFPIEQPPFYGSGKLCILEFEVTTIPPLGNTLSCDLMTDSGETYLIDPNGDDIPGVQKDNGYYALVWGGPQPPPGVYIIGTAVLADMPPGSKVTLTFSWNTTGMLSKSYVIWAEASTIFGETDTFDNRFTDGVVRLKKYPVARFTYFPEFPLPGTTVVFNASTSTPDGGTIVNYYWDFGDGSNVSTPDAIQTHVYSSSGLFSVALTITDSDGLTHSTWRMIHVFVRDIAVSCIIPLPAEVYVGRTMTIDVTVWNEGEVSETFNVTLYYNAAAELMIGVQQVSGLRPCGNTTLTFVWNTTGLDPHVFELRAVATQVPGETDTLDNALSTTVIVKMLGDINGDGKVDLKDYFMVSKAYGEVPGRPRWDPRCDINDDGKIDLKDIYIVAKHFGRIY